MNFILALNFEFLIVLLLAELILVIYFALTCKYVQIRQQSILDRLHSLKRRSNWLNLNLGCYNKKKISSKTKDNIELKLSKSASKFHTLIWREFISLNRASIHMCRYLGISNRFWSRYLTYDFILFTFFICYSAYILLLANIGFGPKSLFAILASYSCGSLWLIIHQCSGLVQNNRKITEMNQYFFKLFLEHQTPSPGGMATWLRQVLKAETVTLALWEKPGNSSNESNNATYGYRLLNNHRIDLGTFYFVSFFWEKFQNFRFINLLFSHFFHFPSRPSTTLPSFSC